MKRFLLITVCFILILNTVSCSHDHDHDHGHESTTNGIATLSPQDLILIDTIDKLATKISKEDFVDFVIGLEKNIIEYNGQIFLLEGFLSNNYYGEQYAFLYQTKDVEGYPIQFGIPLKGLNRTVKNDSEVRVYGIITTAEVNGKKTIVLDMLTIESIT